MSDSLLAKLGADKIQVVVQAALNPTIPSERYSLVVPRMSQDFKVSVRRTVRVAGSVYATHFIVIATALRISSCT